MKRKIALFMVLAMLISLVPMNVFAASTNTVLTAPTIKKDNSTSSTLRIEEASVSHWTVGVTRTFELAMTNGEFTQGTNNTAITVVGGGASATAAGSLTNARVSVAKKTDTVAVVQLFIGATSGTNKLRFDIPVGFKATGGEVTVKLDPRDSQVTPGTYSIGNGVSGATNTTIASVKTFADTVVLDTLRIDENTINTVGVATQTIELKLPAGFEWYHDAASLSSAGGWKLTSDPLRLQIDGTDARIANIKVDPVIGAPAAERGTMYISNLKIKRTSDAKVGDVVLNVKGGDLTEQGVVVAKYATYDVTVVATGDPLSIYSGKWDATNKGNSDDNKLVKLRIKEEVMNSWLAQRITKIQFNDEVKIMGFKIRKDDNITGGSIKTDGNASLNVNGNLDNYQTTTLTNRNYIEISNATITPGKKAEVELEFFVSVKANYTGDITATVSGTALTKETKVVLGKAVAPAAVSVVAKDLRLGLQNQLIGDIVITEPAKGVWGANANGTSEILQFWFEDGTINEKGVPTVTKGDVTLGNYTTAGSIPIKYSSTVASEITIKGVTLDLVRSIPEGKFNIKVGGTSIVDNHNAAETFARFNQSSAVSALAFNVITPADGNTKTIQKVVFTIDSMEYMVGDAKVTSDVAPYVNENGRTMLPLRAFANALNVTNDNIVWNEAERSVIIFKGESTVKVVIGQMAFEKNGVNVPMDTMAMIKDGRTMLPLRAVAQALGAQIAWDDATRTVTVQ